MTDTHKIRLPVTKVGLLGDTFHIGMLGINPVWFYSKIINNLYLKFVIFSFIYVFLAYSRLPILKITNFLSLVPHLFSSAVFLSMFGDDLSVSTPPGRLAPPPRAHPTGYSLYSLSSHVNQGFFNPLGTSSALPFPFQSAPFSFLYPVSLCQFFGYFLLYHLPLSIWVAIFLSLYLSLFYLGFHPLSFFLTLYYHIFLFTVCPKSLDPFHIVLTQGRLQGGGVRPDH